MRQSKKRITAAEFDAVVPLLNMSESRLAAARSALVDGEAFQSVGDRLGCTRQAIYDAVSIVWRTWEKYQEVQRTAANSELLMPPGWEKVTLIAPTELIARFRNEVAQAATHFTERAKDSTLGKEGASDTRKSKSEKE